MIKLTLELTDNKFLYDYEVGTSAGHGDMPLSPDSLVIFTNALHQCYKANHREQEEFMNKINAGAYLEKTLKVSHPKLFEQVDTILRKL